LQGQAVAVVEDDFVDAVGFGVGEDFELTFFNLVPLSLQAFL
jgi:hypothetical protein